jgi:hypothetical protein
LLQQQNGAILVFEQQCLKLFYLFSKPQNLLVPCVEALCGVWELGIGGRGRMVGVR